MTIQPKETCELTFNEEKMKLLKSTIARGCSDHELELFVHSCKRLGLDPFMKQIYAVKRGDQMTIQTGIDGYRLIAERSGKYMPGREPTYCYDGKALVSATAYVKKMGHDGQWHEVASTAFMAEYNANNNMWRKMPHVMLAKCAESAALRKAFPAEMSGIYTEEEMAQADHGMDHTLSLQQVIDLNELIGDDEEYRKKILGFYKVDCLSKLKASTFDMIMERVIKYNESKKVTIPVEESHA